MRIFTILGVIFYTIALLLIGGVFIIAALDWLPMQDVYAWLEYIRVNQEAKVVLGLVGTLLILITISFAQLILGKIQRERTIAFSNPTGQVTIALSAVEDLIIRLVRPITEVKEVRPDVVAGKRGIEIDLRLTLRSEVNIPELTDKLQSMVKSKVQEILGIDEEIIVRIHVLKIVQMESKSKRQDVQKEETPTIPYSGYR